MKTCSSCKKEKPKTEFCKDKYKRDGLHCHCKACHRDSVAKSRELYPETNSNWYKANRDRVKATTAAWVKANPEKVIGYQSKYRDANRAKKRADSSAWQKANREKAYAINAKWAAANPEARRIIAANRRARKRKSGGKLSKDLTAKLFALQRGKCACGCKQPLGTDYHLDHIMPLALGGTNTDDNMQLLRSRCNLEKWKKHPVEFMQKRGFLC